MNSLRVVLTPVVAAGLGGCATILSGSAQLMTVNANVQGAEVHIVTQAGEEILVGTTPVSTSVERGRQGFLRVRADGYQTYQAALNRTINNTFWVNILLGGTFGSTTDYSTGAMYEYEPSTFMVTLQPADQTTEIQIQWELEEGLRAFVLMNGEAVLADLAKGHGEYIDVLVDVLEVHAEEQHAAVERWRHAYTLSETAADFAERIVSELGAA